MLQSTTNPACPNAVTTGANLPIASLAPVERTATGCGLRGLGTTTWNGLAPSRSKANSARCTLSWRDCVSDRIAALSPLLTAQRAKTSQKASIHLPSMRSANIAASLAERKHVQSYAGPRRTGNGSPVRAPTGGSSLLREARQQPPLQGAEGGVE